ncbi:MAG: hypothetical protein J4N85_05040 [Chloroflexi bacterium]|nr:hypothetical protein [Chloroflexota bacterium]
MAFPGRPFRSFVSRVVRRRRVSDSLTHAANDEFETITTDGFRAETPEQDIAAEQIVPQDSSEDGRTLTQSAAENDHLGRTEGAAADELSESSSPSLSEPSSNPEGDSNDESAAESQGSPESHTTSSLAEILANPLPPELSVDNLISQSLGNIFQNKVTKDPHMKALLDLQIDIDMRELAVELKEFANEIGASKN